MKKWISTKPAGYILLIIFSALAVFHILVLLGLMPSDIVWGGQAGDSSINMRTLELISLIFTVLFALVVAARIGMVRAGWFAKAVPVCLWIIFIYLLLNTAGNLAAKTLTEKWIFTPVTVAAALLVLRLAIEK
ncbi:hypothetical protein JW948_07775 [bacterium]|nr:hypothetical protein [bacterium]